jgi:hypothetical protein
LNISDRLRALERSIGPTDKLTREIEAVSRRVIDAVNRIGLDDSLGDVEAMLEQVRAARRRQQR